MGATPIPVSHMPATQRLMVQGQGQHKAQDLG